MKTQHLKFICAMIIALGASYAKADTFKTLESKALAGDAKAQFELAKMYELGHANGRPEFALALSWYEEAARNGLKIASYRIKMLNQP